MAVASALCGHTLLQLLHWLWRGKAAVDSMGVNRFPWIADSCPRTVSVQAESLVFFVGLAHSRYCIRFLGLP